LIVDDNVIQTKRLSKICEPYCALCVTAYNGKQAIQKAKSQKFDLCFMDILMPELGGIPAVRSIRTFDKEIVIYGISANSFRSDYESMKEAGAVEVFTKPIDKMMIIDILKQMSPHDARTKQMQ
jgi:CheY-like chemotaxis protein